MIRAIKRSECCDKVSASASPALATARIRRCDIACYARPGALRNAAASLYFIALAFALAFIWSGPIDVN